MYPNARSGRSSGRFIRPDSNRPEPLRPYVRRRGEQDKGRFSTYLRVVDAFAGIALVLRTPRLWPLCVGPLLLALLAYALLGIGIGFLVVPRLADWLRVERGSGGWWVMEFGFVILWLVLFSFVFTLLAGVFSGLIWDKLCRAVETILDGDSMTPPDAPLGWAAAMGDAIGRLLLNGTLALLALGLSLFLGPIPGVLAAALAGLLDTTAPAYLRRGVTLSAQWRRLIGRPDRGTLGFALVAGMLSLLPLVGVLLMPGLVAGGTLLARRREREFSSADG